MISKKEFTVNVRSDRKITRMALLQDYTGHPERLLHEMDEVAGKGYSAVMFAAGFGKSDAVRELCEKAASLGLGVWLFTGYMKYQYKYMAEHPEQRMVRVADILDQDGLGTSSWGCPFNPEFKKRYLDLLREIAAYPAVCGIHVNDEASLADGCYCAVCRRDYERDFDCEMPVKTEPCATDWEDESWRRFLKWRIDRWNAVHGEMARVVHAVNPKVEVFFQASPHADMSHNPWKHAVDLAGMASVLDGISTDPYYTFHRRAFDPAEVYLSEWSRFLVGLTPDGKGAQIIPQGFSHPMFTRPLGEEDGYWSALIPPACGINAIIPYTYTLQRCSPVQKTYEQCFAFDKYFESTTPLRYAAVAHGVKTEIYRYPLPAEGPDSYDATRMLPVSESLRHRGLPYGYFPDARLHDVVALSSHKVVVLPEINCLTEEEAAGVRGFVEAGGNLVILGDLGSADAIGTGRPPSLLEEITGIRIRGESGGPRRLRMLPGGHIAPGVMAPDVPADSADYMEGTLVPICTLSHCVDAQAPSDAAVLAEFADDNGTSTRKPAIVSLTRGGRILWFAGFPTRRSRNPKYGTVVLNPMHQVFADLAEWTAAQKPLLRVQGWPPHVPMKQLRPSDQRNMSTFEFFPLGGDDCFLGLVTSYFKEPATFPMVLDVPPGRELAEVTELIEGRNVPFELHGGSAAIQVALTFNTPARLFLFKMK